MVAGSRPTMCPTICVMGAPSSTSACPGGGAKPSLPLDGCAALIVLAARLRNSMQRPGRLWKRAFRREVAERHDADETLVAIHDGETPDAELRHVFGDMSDIFILE